MAFGTHLKVLLWKNCLTLQRNYCFAITFLVLPLITMGIFLYAVVLIPDNTYAEGAHYDSNLAYLMLIRDVLFHY